MVNFFIFNFILFIVSYLIDYIAVDIIGLVEWSREYIYYLVTINIPFSTVITYIVMKKIKNSL